MSRCVVFSRHAAARALATRVLLGTVLTLSAGSSPATQPKAEAVLERGVECLRLGRFEEAIPHLREAGRLCGENGERGRQAEVLLKLSSVYQQMGQLCLALETAREALGAAEGAGPKARAAGRNGLGAILTLQREHGEAERCLGEALAGAEEAGAWAIQASVWHNFGNLFSARQEYGRALESYDRAAEICARLSWPALHGRVLANRARAAVRAGLWPEAIRAGADAEAALAAGEASHDQAMVWLSLGRTYERLSAAEAADRAVWMLRASECYRNASEVGRAIRDRYAQTYALGYLAGLYAADGQPKHARPLYRRAMFEAQRIQLTGALYRWQWGLARVCVDTGSRAEATRHYREAVETLQSIRGDLVLGHANEEDQGSFREAVGGLFAELVDLLLQEADAETDPARIRALLLEARQMQERLKSAELQDYFQDSCASLALSKTRPLEAVADRTAVIYVISLTNRTELLLSLPGDKMDRVKVTVGAGELNRTVLDFRRKLEKRTTYEFFRPGWQLYDWLVEPIVAALRSNRVETVVFVPDGPLRLIPPAALCRGTRFLVDEFAVAVTPGLTLLAPAALQEAPARFLLAGLSEPVQGFPALDHVPREVARIREQFGGTVLMNADFATGAVEAQFARNTFSIVHFASHGRFNATARETFLLTYDGRLTLDQLERLIKPSQFRGRPVELLTLSACQTASGDDRAALGLAGVALKAGARSALATLWSVHDEATTLLTTSFYGQIRQARPVSKAKALQLAQQELIADPRYQHPAYWAPYLIVGNWL